MALVLTEEQMMLQESARDFLQSRTPVSHLRGLRDTGSETGFSAATWNEMAGMGWPAIVIPEAYGGLGFGYTGLGLVLQESGRTLTPSPLLGSAMMAVSLLLRHGSEAQRTALLPAIAAGEHVVGIGFEEQGQHAPHRVATVARESGDGFAVTGTKRFVLDGMAADSFILGARTQGAEGDEAEAEEAGISLFLVPADSAGLKVTRRDALDIQVLADVTLDAVKLPASALLGTLHQGSTAVEEALDVGRIGQSAELLGVMRETFDRTLAYLKERKQFGVPIGGFQALQHRAAVLFGEIEMCKSLVLHATQQLDANGDGLAERASRCKAKVAETAMKVCEEAIQMHGGIGMTDDFDIGFFYKRARILEAQFGDRHYHLDRYARLRGY